MKASIAGLLIICFLSFSFASSIVELKEENFNSFIKDNSYAIIEFYAPWCQHCKKFAPIYENISIMAKERNIPFAFAKLDANEYFGLREAYNVSSFPTLIVFINGTNAIYKGERTEEAILDFANMRLQIKVIQLKSLQEIQSVQNGKELRSILISDSPETLLSYQESALTTQVYCKFYYISESLGAKAFPKITKYPTALLFRDYTDEILVYRPVLGKKGLKKFFQENEIPDAPVKFSREIADKFMIPNVHNRVGIILFRKEQNAALDKEFDEFRKLTHEKDYIFVISDLKTEIERNAAAYLTVSEFPAFVIVRNEYNTVSKYVYQEEINKDKLYSFYTDWKAGKIQKSLKSQPEILLKDPDAIVHDIVGVSFKREVIDEDADVLVLIYSPTCPHCIKFKPIYTELAEKYRSIKFTMLDGTENEIDGVPVTAYPTVYIYPAKKKDQPVKAEGNTEEYFRKFLKEHCTNFVEPLKKVDL